MKKILYSYAKTLNGYVINATIADKSGDFLCCLCNSIMTLRKADNKESSSMKPHFAHKVASEACTPERVLRHILKQQLLAKLQDYLHRKMPLEFSWDCDQCDGNHSGNLLKRISKVEMDHDLTVVHPDIALLDENEKVIAAIEIIVGRSADIRNAEIYREIEIILIQIVLSGDEDIKDMDAIIGHPHFVDLCFNPKCKECGHHLHKTVMTIAEAPCRQCGSAIKIAFLKMYGSTISPKEFDPEETAFAVSKGVLLKMNYSHTMQEEYLANTCGKCGSFIGNFYLPTQYAAPASFGEIPSVNYEMGFHCVHCEEAENTRDEEAEDE